jgi:hypothetical protein
MSTPNPTSEYMLLFRGPHWDKGLSPEELQQLMGQVMGWFDGLQRQGKVKAGQPLGPEGRTVAGKKGLKATVADGPFAESKEAVGGYLLLQAGSLDEAVAIAKSNPTLEYGITIEVRPVLEECPVFERARKQLLSHATA